jgi:hypothetical protein
MSTDPSYPTPAAFRRALTDKLKELARKGLWSLPQLQRQIAYDRLLERLYRVDQGWVLKGATALLARGIGVRGTIDVDVYRAAAREMAEADLRSAVEHDIDDWFRFELGAATQMDDAAKGARIPVSAYVGATIWTEFYVDLVGSDVQMTGQPDPVPALARVTMPNVEQHGYRAYPLVDHIADKIAAIMERHGTLQFPSTRFKDLIDLVAILTEAAIDAAAQVNAFRSEVERRGLIPPERFNVPDRALWESGYAREARRSLLSRAHTLDDALGIVRPFVDPLLDATAAGTWDPRAHRWTR